jgi:hypothetical protein
MTITDWCMLGGFANLAFIFYFGRR